MLSASSSVVGLCPWVVVLLSWLLSSVLAVALVLPSWLVLVFVVLSFAAASPPQGLLFVVFW